MGLPTETLHGPVHRRQRGVLGLVDEERHRVEVCFETTGAQEATAVESTNYAARHAVCACSDVVYQSKYYLATFFQVASAPEAQGAPYEVRRRDHHMIDIFVSRIEFQLLF